MILRKGRSRARRGTVAVLVALLLPVIIGVTALGLDGGLLFLQRRQAQSIADAAALAGAYSMYGARISPPPRARRLQSARRTASRISSSQVTQPQTGYVAVSVTVTQPEVFQRPLGVREHVGHGDRRSRAASTKPIPRPQSWSLIPRARQSLSPD